jgi:predicted regulator of Ras-like GTPase activity (Roadblock/LC7/MglB family)
MAQVTELDDRIAKCNRILEENPNSQIFAALAEAHRKKGQVDKAFRICQTGLKIHPNYGSAHMVMAKINLDKGLFDWSEMEALRAIELDGHSQAADLLLAEVYIRRGEFSRATKLLNKLQRVGVSNPNVARLLDLARNLPLESPDRPSAAIAPEIHAPAQDTAETRTSSERGISINEMIETVAALQGINGILFVNREGLVAESRWDDPQPIDLFGALAKDIIETINSQIAVSRFGQYENVLIEAEDLILNLIPLGNNFLLIKGNKHANLGTLRLKLASLLEKLNKDFSQ